jgi:MinD-like ATPase involved in chromosome partitioning or flagellar assembly
MLIAVWGRDGIGKSALCDTLGILFARQGVIAVINTDLTQPTLPARLNGMKIDADASLGKAVGMGAMDAAPYLHQHPKLKTLFYAGLTDKDEYLSYELGLETNDAAQDFVERCAELADTVILDLSGQRSDPFLPGALIHADRVIALFTPDVQGICWYGSIKPLLATMNAQTRILPVAAMAGRQHDLYAVEKAVDTKLTAALPYVQEFRQDCDPGAGTTPAAMRYLREVKKLHALLEGGGAK